MESDPKSGTDIFLMPPAFKLRFLCRSKRQRSKHWRNISTGALFQSSQHLDARERFFALLSAKQARLSRFFFLLISLHKHASTSGRAFLDPEGLGVSRVAARAYSGGRVT